MKINYLQSNSPVHFDALQNTKTEDSPVFAEDFAEDLIGPLREHLLARMSVHGLYRAGKAQRTIVHEAFIEDILPFGPADSRQLLYILNMSIPYLKELPQLVIILPANDLHLKKGDPLYVTMEHTIDMRGISPQNSWMTEETEHSVLSVQNSQNQTLEIAKNGYPVHFLSHSPAILKNVRSVTRSFNYRSNATETHMILDFADGSSQRFIALRINSTEQFMRDIASPGDLLVLTTGHRHTGHHDGGYGGPGPGPEVQKYWAEQLRKLGRNDRLTGTHVDSHQFLKGEALAWDPEILNLSR
ncbi:MAG: hypothetical protein KGR16_07560 [Verrucomicrobia bacterium]|nr:hypothetical protein [Verrucomicrobiota bacterium]MDE3047439.1 hypothetical protein [Verrucomicrobiota bacterium]